MRPVTVAPSRIAGGGSVRPTLTSKVRVTGLACGATSRTRPRAVTDGSSVRLTVISGSLGADADDLRRHVEDRVAPVLARKLDDHLAGLHDLAGARAGRGHDARGVRLELGEAHQIVGGLQLRFGGVDLRLGGLPRLRRLIVVRARRPALLEKRVLALEVVARLRQLALGGGEIGLRRAQGVQLVLRLQAGHHLPGLHPVAELEVALEQPPRDAERQARLRPRPRCGR